MIMATMTMQAFISEDILKTTQETKASLIQRHLHPTPHEQVFCMVIIKCITKMDTRLFLLPLSGLGMRLGCCALIDCLSGYPGCKENGCLGD